MLYRKKNVSGVNLVGTFDLSGNSRVMFSIGDCLKKNKVDVKIFFSCVLNNKISVFDYFPLYYLQNNDLYDIYKFNPKKDDINIFFDAVLFNNISKNRIGDYLYVHYPSFYLSDKKINILCNSNYTKKAIEKNWEVKDVFVIYPPIEIIPEVLLKKKRKRNIDILTVGRITRDKNLFLLTNKDISKKKVVVGKLDYNNIENIEVYNVLSESGLFVYPNLCWKDLENLYLDTKIYLHCKKDEHFGIAILDAINYGCYPLVQNNGGQLEIINNEKKYIYLGIDSFNINKHYKDYCNKDRKKILEKFSYDVTYRALEQVLW